MLKISSKTEREFFGIVEDRRLGGVPRYYFGYPDDWNMWIPDEVRKCVAFIGVEEVESEKTYYSPKGTGFFVSFADEGNKNLHHIYLITAKHVIEGIGDRRINVRVNYKDGKAKNIILPKETRWFYHPTDSNVDVAITPFYNENFDIKTIPNNMFFSVEELKGEIGIGSEVFITGLFANHYGKEKNIPIVRFGNIAMISDEKVSVSWHSGCEIDAYLIEARSIGGISGSPVFFATSPIKGGSLILKGGGKAFYLGGLIHGHYDSEMADNIQETKKEKSEKSINMGIAIVIPASKILETLNQEELKQRRIVAEREYNQKNNPTKLD